LKPLYWYGLKMNGMVSMTHDEIIEMLAKVYGVAWTSKAQLRDLTAFAKLVAQHEREAILAVIGDNQCECRCSEVVRDRGKV